MPVSKILFWSGFGLAVRLWQLAIEQRSFFHRAHLWVYPVYMSIGGGFGYWLTGVEQRQIAYMQQRRDSLMEKRKRRADREGVSAGDGEEAEAS